MEKASGHLVVRDVSWEPVIAQEAGGAGLVGEGTGEGRCPGEVEPCHPPGGEMGLGESAGSCGTGDGRTGLRGSW